MLVFLSASISISYDSRYAHIWSTIYLIHIIFIIFSISTNVSNVSVRIGFAYCNDIKRRVFCVCRLRWCCARRLPSFLFVVNVHLLIDVVKFSSSIYTFSIILTTQKSNLNEIFTYRILSMIVLLAGIQYWSMFFLNLYAIFNIVHPCLLVHRWTFYKIQQVRLFSSFLFLSFSNFLTLVLVSSGINLNRRRFIRSIKWLIENLLLVPVVFYKMLR